ncbi:MAG: DUF167 family protein [Thermoplasmata archaeon]
MKDENLLECIQNGNGGVYLDVAISPNASRTKMTGVNQWRDNLEIFVEAEPSKGEANKTLINHFSRELEIHKDKIGITRGNTSKKKRIFFKGINKEDLKERIKTVLEA